MSTLENTESNNRSVVDVWASNLDVEIRNIENVIRKGYTVIAIDTEYPGIIHKPKYNDRTATGIYSTMKANVDTLKPIQVGVSFSSLEGTRPSRSSTWQFNLKFDSVADSSDPKSMELLTKANISFESLLKNGIDLDDFKNAYEKSGLHLNPLLTWVSFHGAYDFAYMIKILTRQPLPETLKGFNDLKKSIFSSVYDVKMLIQGNDVLQNYSLDKLSQVFRITPLGTLHQAGTDAFVTGELFFGVKSNLHDHKIKKFENKLYGLNKVFSRSSAEFDAKSKKETLGDRIKMLRALQSNEKKGTLSFSMIDLVASLGLGIEQPYILQQFGYNSVEQFVQRSF